MYKSNIILIFFFVFHLCPHFFDFFSLLAVNPLKTKELSSSLGPKYSPTTPKTLTLAHLLSMVMATMAFFLFFFFFTVACFNDRLGVHG
jgi:hypothetical protein